MAAERILIVDDDEDVLLIVQTILDNAGYTAVVARNGREGVEKAIEGHPDLILLDVMMPELSGWEVCTTLKSAPETRHIPIAMLTVKSEIRDLITGMQVGADDYITKPFTRKKLLSTVRRLLEEKRAAPPAFLGSENEEVRFQNLLFDSVTELPTVPVIIDALRDRLLDNREMGVLYIDVEQYSHIEEAYGWEVFDGLLKHTARTLRRMVGTVFATEDFVAVNRAGGSDFYVFASLEAGEDAVVRLQRKARQVEESLRSSLDEAFGARIHKRIGVFVGHALLRPNPQMRIERLVYRGLRQAIAVATTKEEERQAHLRESFRDILRRERIRSVYQPIFQLERMDLFGHEALTRGPALFTQKHPIVLEVTERSAIRDVSVFRSALTSLRQLGFRIAIDDAGSGYASLQAIAELRPDYIKVANTLITGLRSDSIKRDVVEMLVNLSRRIDAVCVAEGIETPEDLEECRALGIPYGQGFYLGVPAEKPADEPAREFTGRIRTAR
jgi:EAL domain-containing protein (putative c-di-GMP-specific phosphodiesterase class I)/DNA-binding response OmpR family regulator